MNVRASLIKVITIDGTPPRMEPEKHTDFGLKLREFVSRLENSPDAVKALQKYI